MPAPSPLPKYLYKILPTDPTPFLAGGLPVSELDKKDGFIHLSTLEQVPGTLGRFFNDVDVVYLLKVPYAKVEAKIKWDEAGPGTFPHIYDDDMSKSLSNENVEGVIECRKGGSGTWDDVVEQVLAG